MCRATHTPFLALWNTHALCEGKETELTNLEKLKTSLPFDCGGNWRGSAHTFHYWSWWAKWRVEFIGYFYLGEKWDSDALIRAASSRISCHRCRCEN